MLGRKKTTFETNHAALFKAMRLLDEAATSEDAQDQIEGVRDAREQLAGYLCLDYDQDTDRFTEVE